MTDRQHRAEEYLLKIRATEKNITNKRLELEALLYKASGAGAIRYDVDHVQTSPKDYMAMAIADAIELEKQIKEAEESAEEERGHAYSIVRQIEDAEHRIIIEWFYLNGLPMARTAEHLNMSERSAYYLKDDALESFGSLMN